MRGQVDHLGRWQAIAYMTLAALAITNAAWFYNWRVKANDHHQALMLERSKSPEEIVVYRYQDQPQSATPAPAKLDAEERCMAGQILRKIPNGWAGTGRRC
ncbi:hypothetical protein ACW7G2_13910 [Luteimonas sp. A277]